jgi:hypothetical protein
MASKSLLRSIWNKRKVRMDCSSDAALFKASVFPVASGAAGEMDRVDLLLGPVCRP